MSTIATNMPPTVVDLIQQGALQRYFYEGLFPNLGYRSEYIKSEWGQNAGEEKFMTREGVITPITEPAMPGVDPTPQPTPYEQWSSRLYPYNNAKDVHIPTSKVSNANQFLAAIKQLGMNAAQSVNRVARNTLFKSYLSGQTVLTVAALTTDTVLQVASLNGFTDVITNIQIRPGAVSPASPLPVRCGVAGVQASVIQAIANNPSDPTGPGQLILSAAIGAALPLRAAVVSAYAPRVIRASGGASIDSIGASDTLTLQQVLNAVGFLRDANVPTHEDGFYHAHISGGANSQIFQDPVFQRLNQSLPEHHIYKEGFIGTIAGVMFFMNTESPSKGNTGSLLTTASSGMYSKELGAEVVNGVGVPIGRVLITGKGVGYEEWLNEFDFVTDAGLNGKVADFQVTNGGVSIMTENIRLIMRAPIDRLQQMVGLAWSISTSFATPSDITAPSGPERYKRAIVLEHAAA
jgi:hypothetical protein